MGYGNGFTGPDRTFQPLPFAETMGGMMEREVQARQNAAPVRLDNSWMQQQAENEQQDARYAMTPGVQRPGDQSLGPNASLAEAMTASLKPRSWSQGGKDYRFDPRLAMGGQAAQTEMGYQLGDAADARKIGMQNAQSDRRVQQLIDAGYSKKIAVRQVYGGGATPEETGAENEKRWGAQLERSQMIQDEMQTRAKEARDAKETITREYEGAKYGNAQSQMQLRAALATLENARKSRSALEQANRANLSYGRAALPVPEPDENERQAQAVLQTFQRGANGMGGSGMTPPNYNGAGIPMSSGAPAPSGVVRERVNYDGTSSPAPVNPAPSVNASSTHGVGSWLNNNYRSAPTVEPHPADDPNYIAARAAQIRRMRSARNPGF